MEGASQDLKVGETRSPNTNGWHGLSGEPPGHAGVNGYSMEDSDTPNPWPGTPGLQRSSSGSSLGSSTSHGGSDVLPDDANMAYNKHGSSTGKVSALPRANVPEKIIICLDLSTDTNATPFRFGDGTKYTPLSMMKRVIHLFMYGKQFLNPDHEYALVVLYNNNATWIQDFTNDPKQVISILFNLTDSPPQGEGFDLSVLCNTIEEHCNLPHVDDPLKTAPPFTVRVILLYARSRCFPSFSGKDLVSYEALRASPYFFLDLLYIHEPVNDENKKLCEAIFHSLCSQVCTETSYVFNVARNATKMHDCMSKLLAHSLQRPSQEDAEYKLLPEGT